jgi:hypothetical protein
MLGRCCGGEGSGCHPLKNCGSKHDDCLILGGIVGQSILFGKMVGRMFGG